MPLSPSSKCSRAWPLSYHPPGYRRVSGPRVRLSSKRTRNEPGHHFNACQVAAIGSQRKREGERYGCADSVPILC